MYEPGVIEYAWNPNTWKVAAKDQELEVSLGSKSLRPAWVY